MIPMKDSPYRIPKSSPAALLSLFFMGAAGGIRILYFCLMPMPAMVCLLVHLVLPLAAVVWFILAVLLRGETKPQWTAGAVLIGIVFFILKSFTFASVLHTVLCILLYLTVLVLYSLTIFGRIPTKGLLYPLFGLPLLYHIFVEDMQIYILADPPVPFVEWLPEISVLCIMASLLSVSFALQKR